MEDDLASPSFKMTFESSDELIGEASLVAQTVKPLPTMRETRVQSLGWGDLLEKEMAAHSSILAWKIPWMEEPGRLHGVAKSQTRLSDFTHSLTPAPQHTHTHTHSFLSSIIISLPFSL